MEHYQVRGFQETDLSRFSSINAQGEAGDLSSRYSFIPTSRVVSVFEKHGFLPVFASEVQAKKDEHIGFQKHLIRFRQPNALPMLNECFPEIILTNSHNGLSSFKLMSGLYRLVCYNGLIAAEGEQDKLTIRHTGYTDEQVSMAIEYLMGFLPGISEKVREFKEIEMTPDEQGVYVDAALTVRYDQEVLQAKRFDAKEILRPIRREDQAITLWNTFNIIQEKFIKGRGIHTVNKADELEAERLMKTDPRYARFNYRPRVKRTKTRGINAISENVRINQALWVLTERMAELKKGHGQMSEMVAA
jgi:hypothetical protein